MLLSLKVNSVNSVFAGEFSQTETMCLQEVMLPLPSAERFCRFFFLHFRCCVATCVAPVVLCLHMYLLIIQS